MTCVICQREIENYAPKWHNFQVDGKESVSICNNCADKLMKWHAERLATLFPTKAMKRMHRRDR